MDAAKEPSKPSPTAAPLLSVGPLPHGNYKVKSINSVAKLFTALVKPTHLQTISNANFADGNIKKFLELVQI